MKLKKFYVFNSSYCTEEGQESKKILYFYPADTAINTQIRDVGRCEAILTFCETFHDGSKCEVVHTQNTRQYLTEPEKGFFIVLTIFLDSEPESQRFSEPNDDILASILHQSYFMYRLFYNTFTACTKKEGVEALKTRLNFFYLRYLQTLSFEQLTVSDIYRGIQFLPLDRLAFLRVQNFLAALEDSFQIIKHSVFLYQNYLVWSGLGQHDMQCIYHYLVTSLFPSSAEQDQMYSPPRYLTGPVDLRSSGSIGKLPRVFLNHIDSIPPTECTLIAYRSLNSTVILFVDGNVDLTFEWFIALDLLLAPRLTELSHELSDQCAARKSHSSSSQEQEVKFIYFNKLNLACKSTLSLLSAEALKNSNGLTQDIISLADLHCSLKKLDQGELIARTQGDTWIIGRKSDNREFFIILQEKNYNLIDVEDEVRRLCNTQFSNIFLADSSK
ncbi:vacuolar fusion protein CCZ1 homolog [Artemia franciscana]|uniref:CCZ1/INTU/HSP4 first Longin domain-containing protein n=1 Tax=Artemia franciscana TaxID=6661 RepID=A0AA88L657_ARTSF|nr:hypothetical protein QYM36_008793 [Artemia franciscana]